MAAFWVNTVMTDFQGKRLCFLFECEHASIRDLDVALAARGVVAGYKLKTEKIGSEGRCEVVGRQDTILSKVGVVLVQAPTFRVHGLLPS